MYKVSVMEVRRKVVTVPAANEREAHQRVSDAWNSAEFMLTDDDFEGVEFYVIGETESPVGLKIGAKGE